MKRTLLLLAVLMWMPLCLLAQYSLSGLVRSAETGEVLPGANVHLLSARRLTATSTTGEFQFNNLNSGTYTLRISYVGYKSWEEEVQLNSDRHLEVALPDDGFLADEVVVTATRATEQTPTTFTEVSKDQLRKQNLGQDIPYLLQFTPSVVSTSDAGAGVGYTGIRIRGSDATRINVTINGIPLNDSESHGVFWVNTPDLASSVDNLQIQRGVGTSTNGAAAFGATVNIQTERLNPEPYAEVQASVGSFNTQRYAVKAGTGLLNNHFAVDARLSSISSEGYIDRASSDLKSFFVSGGYYDDKTLLKANIFSGSEQTYQAWYGTPEAVVRGDRAGIEAYIARNWIEDEDEINNLLNAGRTYNYYTYDNETDNYQQDHYQLLFGRDLTDNLQINLAGHYTRGRGYYEQFRNNDMLSDYGLPDVVIADSTISETDLIRRRWLDNDFYGFTYAAAWEPAGKLKLTLGGGWNKYEGGHFGEIIWARYASTSNIRDRYYDNSATKRDFNTFLKGYYELTTKLDLFADLQYRSISYQFGGLDQGGITIAGDFDYHFWNPKAGLTYRFNPGSRLYASYAIGQREPVRSDFIDAPTNDIPEPEVLRNLETGVEVRVNRQLQFSANYYLMNYKNQLVLTGELNDVGAAIRINVPESYRTGVELQGVYTPWKVLRLQGNAAFSRNIIRNFDDVLFNYDDETFVRTELRDSPISFSPNVVANAIVTVLPVQNLELSLLSQYVSRQYLDNTGSTTRSLDDYLITDFRVNYVLRPRFVKELRLNLLVNNIFNAMYANNGYTYGYISGGETIYENFLYPQAGTNFLFGVSVGF
ncbi:TonB-dependent receptor [Cesiribacter sp. SM1]|uniref:TonB-dependent receptor n=1 Tax=Cesiribacter sp. SM1 TaxID=2861196 RepID=UPI001CD5BA9C|nr:TonB-dependent receptor [Cesiribacter sp. SM1]